MEPEQASSDIESSEKPKVNLTSIPSSPDQDSANSDKYTSGSLLKAKKELDELTKNASDLIGKLQGVSAKAEEYVAAAAASQAKADNEALRAFQAKQMVEGHSSSVAQIKGEVEAQVATVAKLKTELESVAQSVTNLKQTAEADATAIASVRKTAEEASNAIATHQGKVSVSVSSIEALKEELENLSQQVRASSKAVEADISGIVVLKGQADSHLGDIRKASSEGQGLLENSKAISDSIEKYQVSAKSSSESIADISKKVSETDSRVLDYEEKISKLQKSFHEIKGQVEGLLPGATSASLASSFRTQKERFKAPQHKWMVTFITCIGVLVVIATVGIIEGQKQETWDSILRVIVQRLPLMLPLIWLALYAGRQYMLAQRMEEDYAFKEAISTAFEGYKRELGSIQKGISPDSPLLALCHSVLSALNRRPGRIYEGKVEDVTPLSPVGEGLTKILTTGQKPDEVRKPD
jgi:chaperonin cofactor prefoldin